LIATGVGVFVGMLLAQGRQTERGLMARRDKSRGLPAGA
jgi:hypothetical protein